MQADEIKQIIESNIPECKVLIDGEDGVHFNAIVISKEFEGKSKVQQQQMVYSALGDRITSGDVHALSLKTITPEEHN